MPISLPSGPTATGFAADACTAGPWDPLLQHGGPPSALLVHAAERAAADATGRDDLIALRYAAEFVGPVPVAEVDVETEIVRAARSGVLVSARLSGMDRPCLHARIWLVRDADTGTVAHVGERLEVPAEAPGVGANFPYGRSIEWRALHGSLDEPGPGSVWTRPRIAVVAGAQLSGLQRAVLVGDSASGVSAELSWNEWSFLNVDLDVHLARPVEGDWLLMDATTQLGGARLGLGPLDARTCTGRSGRRQRPSSWRPADCLLPR